jgi:Zn-dependent protease with chaperone function
LSPYNALGVLLECAAIAVVLSASASVLSLALVSMGARLSPSARADLAFTSALLPALVVMVALAAALAPTLSVALVGSGTDHCPEHLHHPHLCLIHFGGLRPAAAVLGAFSLAVFVARSLGFVTRHARTATRIAQLERLGAATLGGAFPLVELPGAPRVCHAVGAFRRRIIVSGALVEGLSAPAWSAVRAHEDEHLRRRDPLAMMVVEAALLFVPPFFSTVLGHAFRRAAEAACDAAAAHEVGDGIAVAEGLLEAARIFGPAAPAGDALGAPAATDLSLEERVRDLLAHQPSTPRRSLGFFVAGLLTMGLCALGLTHGSAVHHALETLLFHLT